MLQVSTNRNNKTAAKVFFCFQNFEAAVQENVLVNGLSWEEAPDHGD